MKKLTTMLQNRRAILSVLLTLFMVCTEINFCAAQEISQDEVTVSGTVTDASTNEPLPGVAVVIKGTTMGTITDENGHYSLNVPSGRLLQFSFMGYLNEEIMVTDATEISVSLVNDIIGLDEVVVVGYGVQKKSDLTGAVSSVTSEDLAKIPVAGIDQALMGMASGVTVIPKSGRPGSGIDIQIRGISSINGTKPVIVIDGVTQDNNVDGVNNALSRLNPNDIESIEILKDASSAAIYGASGGNGVILITTKKGKSGGLQVNYNTYMGFERPISKLELMNSQQWMELLEEMSSFPTAYTTRPDTFNTYDWQDIIFKQAFSYHHDLSVTGGNDKSSYLISASYGKQDGIIKNTDNQRFTLRINSDHKISKFIHFDEKVYYTNTVNYGFEDWEYQQYYANPVMPALQMAPYLPAYQEDGSWSINEFGGGTNPLVQLDLKDKTRRNHNIDGNFGVTLTPLKGLSYTSRFAGGIGFNDEKEYKPAYYASATDSRPDNELYQKMSRFLNWNFQNVVTYNATLFNNHNLTVMAGMEASKNWDYYVEGTRLSFRSDVPEMLYFSMSSNDTIDRQNVEGRGNEARKYRYFGRINYSFKGKYLLTANISRDYSSNFGPQNRAGTFPSFSVGWKFTEEEFMNNLSFLTFGKIRIGYGQTGANARDGFPYLTQIRTPGTFKYSFDNNISLIGAGPVQVANPAIMWESVNMTNIGLDLSFFDYRLNITAEWFDKVNEGMLMFQEVPSVAGTYSMGTYFDDDDTQPEVNIGSIRNRGFELTIGHKNRINEFRYSANLNLSVVRNKILDLAVDSIREGSAHNVSPITLTRIGGAISEFYGWETDGIFRETDPTTLQGSRVVITNQPYYVSDEGDTIYAQQNAQPGDVRYVDLNGDGRITVDDKTSLGSPLPKFTFGLSLNFEYKGFDMNMLFNGSIGNKVFNGTKQYLYYSQGNGNRLAVYADRYKDEVVKDGFVVVQENHDTDIPRHAADNYTRPSEFFIEDGSFVRLRNIQLGYTLPKSITQIAGIDKLRFYVGAKNLFTITSYTSFNPEVSSGDNVSSGSGGEELGLGIDFGNYPITRMFLVGVNLQF